MPNSISGIGDQMANVYVQYFVPQTGGVETQTGSFRKYLTGSHFCRREPPQSGKRILGFVSVAVGGGSRQRFLNMSGGHFANSLQVVLNFASFERNLSGIRHVLPFAAPAGTKVGTNGFNAVWRRDGNGLQSAFHVSFFLAVPHHRTYIARSGSGNQKRFAFWGVRHAHTARSRAFNLNIFPLHGAKIGKPLGLIFGS
jgi:hypothetical protein